MNMFQEKRENIRITADSSKPWLNDYLNGAVTDLTQFIKSGSKYRLTGEDTFAFPVENVDPAIAQAVAFQLQELNFNANSTYFVEGAFRQFWEFGFHVAHEVFGLPWPAVKENFGILTLPSASFSVEQAISVGLQKAYRENSGRNFLKDGSAKAAERGFKPVVVAPVTAKFLLDRIVGKMGLGTEAAQYYAVDQNFQPDVKSLDRLLKQLQTDNKTVVTHLLFGGDATRGIMHNNIGEIAEAHRRVGRKPLLVVDASSQWLVAYATGKVRQFDFSNPDVDMIIADPQKVGFPYFTSFLFMRDCQPFDSFNDVPTGFVDPVTDLPKKGIMSSRGITGEFALMTYWFVFGQEGLEEKGLHDFELAEKVRVRLRESELLESYPCDGRIVSYGVKPGIGVDNWQLAQALNNGETTAGLVSVGYDVHLRARTLEEVEKSVRGGTFDGLFGTVTGIHTGEKLNKVFDKIELAAKELSAVRQDPFLGS